MRDNVRILFRDEDDLSLRNVQTSLEQRGIAVACVADERDEDAGLIFGPDLVVVNPKLLMKAGPNIFDRIGKLKHPPAVIIGRDINTDGHLSAIAQAKDRQLDVLGTLDRPYNPGALARHVETLDSVRTIPCLGDLEHVQHLISHGRLFPNLSIDFQTKHSLKTGAVVGYEALARLATRRALNPELIFSAGMDFSIEVEATAVVVDAAARLAAILGHNGQHKQVSFNCSASVIVHGNFCEMVQDAVGRHRIKAENLMVEITEEARIGDADGLIQACQALHECGIAISIDDFGSGMANLDRVAGIPFEELKIDKTVFWACCEGRLPVSVIEGILDFCRKNRRKSVIEGIETEAHLAQAKLMKADYGQGYYWGRAVPPQIFAPTWP